jgi:glycosyltransferase involved in cell wall biosynthesis
MARILNLRKTAIVTTEHGSYNRRRDNKFFRPVERFIYSQYTKIICVNKAAKANLDKWVSLPHKSCVIYNGIDTSKFKNATPYSKAELGLPDGSKVVTMVAHFFQQRDHKTAIKALLDLGKDIHILFCGSGEQGINACKQLAGELGVEERVHFLGNRTDVARIIKTSDVGLLSTFCEGFGLAVLEPMAAGTPVIASCVDGVREVVEGCGILFPVGDYRQLAAEITRLLENRAHYTNVAQKCYTRSLEFGQEQFIEKHLTKYKELCSKN